MMLGGLIGEYVLKDKAQRWALLFAPIAASMWLLQLSVYPNSMHIEWPGSHGHGNSWTNAFVWISDHTPKDAVFALDPDYMLSPGEDEHGFRAAERSALADDVKDSGAVSLFPQLAQDWKMQSNAQRGWGRFQRNDFERLLDRATGGRRSRKAQAGSVSGQGNYSDFAAPPRPQTVAGKKCGASPISMKSTSPRWKMFWRRINSLTIPSNR